MFSSDSGADIMEALVQAGASAHATNAQGDTPLVTAVLFDNAVAVSMLLASGSDAKIRCPDGRVGSLLFGAKSAPVFKLLLNAGLKINERSSQGITVLHSLALGLDLASPVKAPLLCTAIRAGADLSVRCLCRLGHPPLTAAEAAACMVNALAAQLLTRAAQAQAV
jgi:hypothetical protein